MKIPSRRRHFFTPGGERTIKSRIGKIKETETRRLIDLIHEKKTRAFLTEYGERVERI